MKMPLLVVSWFQFRLLNPPPSRQEEKPVLDWFPNSGEQNEMHIGMVAILCKMKSYHSQITMVVPRLGIDCFLWLDLPPFCRQYVVVLLKQKMKDAKMTSSNKTAISSYNQSFVVVLE